MDVTRDELDGPARLRYCKISDGLLKPEEWEGARQFASLREALHAIAAEAPPDGTSPFIMTNTGRTLKPEQLAVTWDALQGPLIKRWRDAPEKPPRFRRASRRWQAKFAAVPTRGALFRPAPP